jgi:excisionase family DNA binding protein
MYFIFVLCDFSYFCDKGRGNVLTAREAAEKIGVTKPSVLSYLRDGTLKGEKIPYGKQDRWRVSEDEVDRFIRERQAELAGQDQAH